MSVKTARRDLEALAIAGIPVYSQAGKGGGWSLIGGARTDLSGLTAAEARTLFMVAGPSSTATPEAKAALRKLVQALPETFRADAEAAASAVVLDPAGWGGSTAPRPPHLDELQRAVVDGAPGAPRLRRPDARRDRAHRPPARASSRRAWSGTSSPTPPTGCARSGSTGCASVAAHRRSRRAPARLRPRRDVALGRRDDRGAAHRRQGRRADRPGDGARAARASSPPASRCSARPTTAGSTSRSARRRPGMIAEQLAGWGGAARGRRPRRGPRPPRPHRPRARRALRHPAPDAYLDRPGRLIHDAHLSPSRGREGALVSRYQYDDFRLTFARGDGDGLPRPRRARRAAVGRSLRPADVDGPARGGRAVRGPRVSRRTRRRLAPTAARSMRRRSAARLAAALFAGEIGFAYAAAVAGRRPARRPRPAPHAVADRHARAAQRPVGVPVPPPDVPRRAAAPAAGPPRRGRPDRRPAGDRRRRAHPRGDRQPERPRRRSTSRPSAGASRRRSSAMHTLGRVQLDWLQPATPRGLRQALRDHQLPRHPLRRAQRLRDWAPTVRARACCSSSTPTTAAPRASTRRCSPTSWATRSSCSSSCSTPARAPARR